MYKVEKVKDPFEFESDGKVYSVPQISDLPLKRFKKIQKTVRDADENMREEVAVDAVLEVFDEFAPGSTDNLTYMQAAKLVSAYANGGEESLGESSPSSD